MLAGPPPPPPPPPRLPRRLLLAAAALLGLVVSALVALWLTLPDPRPLASRNPSTTALMEQRRAEASRDRRPWHPQLAWIPLERISPRLVEAVVASEDATFFGHRGFDWVALREAARHDLARGRFARGASTISQQLAKNLWLGNEKSLLRKVREAGLTAKLERALGKRRILALYLNVAEWGDGVFGAEAGARHHLGTGAANLSTAQAVLLASMLPAPRRVDLARPSAWLRSRATHLLDRLRDENGLTAEEHQIASAELHRLLQGPAPADDREEPPEEDSTSPGPLPPAPPERGEPVSPQEERAEPTPSPTEPPVAPHPEQREVLIPSKEPAESKDLPVPARPERGEPLSPPKERAESKETPIEPQGGTAGQSASTPPEQPPGSPTRPHE